MRHTTQNLIKTVLTAGGLTISLTALAQSDSIPRTEYGFPDLQGTYSYKTLTPLQRPRELADKAVLTPEEAAEWAEYERTRQNRDLVVDSVGGAGYPPGVISYNEFWYERGTDTVGDYRTSLIYDPPNGRLPPVNAMGQQRAAEVEAIRRASAGPEGRTLADRCLMNSRTGPPMRSGSYNNTIQIVQTKDHIMILSEMIHHARIIPFTDEYASDQLQWAGNSVAHWEGDTLVINTRDFYADYGWLNTSDEKVVEERFTIVDENTLDYDFTVEDPNVWDQPWSGRMPILRTEDKLYEYACHEGNHGLAGILAGWRRYDVEGKNEGFIPSVDD